MSTISASTGQILPDGNSSPYTPGQQQNPYNTYVSNMGNLLTYITKKSSAGNAAMIANNEGLQRGQAALATPDSQNNPLNGLYSFMPGSARTGVEKTMGSIMEPAILSNAGQASAANQTAASLQTTTAAQLQGAIAQQNAGIGSHEIGQIPGSLSQYSFDSRTGTYTNLSTGTTSKTPPPADPTQFGNTTFQGIDVSGNATGTKAYASEGVDPSDPNYNAKAGAITAKKWQNIYDGMQSYAQTYYQTQSTKSPEYSPNTGEGTVQGDWVYKNYQWVNQPSDTTKANALGSYIKDHSKGSPISGLMVMNAASQYGLDPWALAAVMANESDFGTSGVAVNTKNPGNNGNTDNGSTTTYQSWQAGVNAVAANLAKRSPGNPNASPAPTASLTTSSNPITSLAAQVLAGLKSPKDADTAVSGINSGAIALNQELMRQSGGAYDASVTQAKYDAKQGSITSQTTSVNDLSSARQSVGNIANSLISQIATNSNLNPSNLNALNLVIQKIAGQTSNPQYQTLVNRMTDIASTYSQILTPGGNTDSTRALAMGLVDQLAKGSSIQKVIADLDQQAQEKISGQQTNIQNIISGNNTNPLTSFINSAIPLKAKEGDIHKEGNITYKVINGVWTPQ